MTSLLARIQFPHPMVLLLCGVLIAALLTWVLPPGSYERRIDPESSREIVVAGTYHRVEAAPVGLAAAFVVVLLRPQLLPALESGRTTIPGQPASYADAVDISAPAVANVYTRRLVANDKILTIYCLANFVKPHLFAAHCSRKPYVAGICALHHLA